MLGRSLSGQLQLHYRSISNTPVVRWVYSHRHYIYTPYNSQDLSSLLQRLNHSHFVPEHHTTSPVLQHLYSTASWSLQFAQQHRPCPEIGTMHFGRNSAIFGAGFVHDVWPDERSLIRRPLQLTQIHQYIYIYTVNEI